MATKYQKNRVAYNVRVTPTQIVHLCGRLEGMKIGEKEQHDLLVDVRELQELFKVASDQEGLASRWLEVEEDVAQAIVQDQLDYVFERFCY